MDTYSVKYNVDRMVPFLVDTVKRFSKYQSPLVLYIYQQEGLSQTTEQYFQLIASLTTCKTLFVCYVLTFLHCSLAK